MSGTSQDTDLIRALNLHMPGQLPEAVFEAVARLVVTPTFVVVPLFKRAGRTRVVLTRRAADDSQYAGMLHPPGKILLATDTDLDAVFDRLVSTELNGLTFRSQPVFVAHFFDQITRGQEISMVHYLELDDPCEDVLSYDPFALPDDVIKTDIPRIAAAVSAFEQDRL